MAAPVAFTEASAVAWQDDVRRCRACPLRLSGCSGPVPGYGPHAPSVVFVSGVVTRAEDADNAPMLRNDAALIMQVLELAGLGREDVWFAPAVRCWSPQVTWPDVQECAARWLLPEVARLRCRIVTALGREAFDVLTLGRRRQWPWEAVLAEGPMRLDRWWNLEHGTRLEADDGREREVRWGLGMRMMLVPMPHPSEAAVPSRRADWDRAAARLVALCAKLKERFGDLTVGEGAA